MENKVTRLENILRISSGLNDIQDLDLLLEKILYEARKIVQADAGTIYIKNGNYLVFYHTQNDTLQKKLPLNKKLPFYSFTVDINKESIAGYVASTGEILNIRNMYSIPEKVPYHFNPVYDQKSNYKTISTLTVPMITNRRQIIGVLQTINARDDNGTIIPFSNADELYILHFSNIASIAIQRAKLTRTILLRMISMAELRDPKETGAHVNRVASYAIELYEQWAVKKQVSTEEINKNKDILRMAAMLHDVGKVAISDTILKKPGKFSPEEYEIIKSHTYIGARLFTDNQSDFDDVAYQTTLTHHENWDGTGYPGYVDIHTGKILEKKMDGSVLPRIGEEIPIFGRVVALADVYDALSNKRVYKDAWSEKDVLKEISHQSGKKFDPDLVDIFFENLEFIRIMKEKYRDED